MKKTNLDRLLHRYVTGQVTEEEKMKIEAWLDVRKTGEGTDMVLDEDDEERLFRKIISSKDDVEQIKAFRPKEGGVRMLLPKRWLQVAATLLILMASAYAVWFVVSKPAVYRTVAGQEIEKFILEDGTIVWLQEESTLTYDDGAEGVRKASLEGAGLFEVAKDPSRPFFVSCGMATVKVTGTSFHLTSRGGGVELKVLTGEVNLFSGAGDEGIEVAGNEMAIYTPNGEIKKVAIEVDEVKQITARTEYNMAFKNTTMESVIKRIEKKFNVEVEVENKELNACRITADFTDHSLVNTLQMISELLEMEYVIEGTTVAVAGRGCH